VASAAITAAAFGAECIGTEMRVFNCVVVERRIGTASAKAPQTVCRPHTNYVRLEILVVLISAMDPIARVSIDVNSQLHNDPWQLKIRCWGVAD